MINTSRLVKAAPILGRLHSLRIHLDRLESTKAPLLALIEARSQIADLIAGLEFHLEATAHDGPKAKRPRRRKGRRRKS